jgi:hypothetical protein
LKFTYAKVDLTYVGLNFAYVKFAFTICANNEFEFFNFNYVHIGSSNLKHVGNVNTISHLTYLIQFEVG